MYLDGLAASQAIDFSDSDTDDCHSQASAEYLLLQQEQVYLQQISPQAASATSSVVIPQDDLSTQPVIYILKMIFRSPPQDNLSTQDNNLLSDNSDDELPQPGADAFNEFNFDEVDNSNATLVPAIAGPEPTQTNQQNPVRISPTLLEEMASSIRFYPIQSAWSL